MYDKRSFIDGMWFAKDLIQNKLADLKDQNPFFEDAIEELATVLCDEIWHENREAIIDHEDVLWGGQKLVFRAAEE